MGSAATSAHTLLTNLWTMLAMRTWLEALVETAVEVWADSEAESRASFVGLLYAMALLEKVGVRPLSVES